MIINTKKIVNIYDFQNLNNGFSHNDFHYNNILFTRDNKIKLIDFENIKYNGFFEFDILALIVMIEVYVNNEEQLILDKYLNKLFKRNRVLKEIYEIYKKAISLNEKFYLNSEKINLNSFEKIKLIFIFIIKGVKNV